MRQGLRLLNGNMGAHDREGCRINVWKGIGKIVDQDSNGDRQIYFDGRYENSSTAGKMG